VPDIFDNLKTESKIGPALMTALTNFDTRDVATGYFDLRGWSSFADIVEAKWASNQTIDPPAVRVLVGMVMPADSALLISALQAAVQPPPYGSDINDMGKAIASKEQLVKHLRTQLRLFCLIRGSITQLGDRVAAGSSHHGRAGTGR
jgi:hypothetical protein